MFRWTTHTHTHFPVVSSSFNGLPHRQDLYGTLEVLGGHVGEATFPSVIVGLLGESRDDGGTIGIIGIWAIKISETKP